jgi:hypothetical protein
MEPDIRQNRRKTWINHLEGLDTAIQVLIVDNIFIVPHTSIWPCYFVTNEENPIVSRIRLHLIYRRARPSHNGRLHPHR